MFSKRRAKKETQKFSDGSDGRDTTQETSDKTKEEEVEGRAMTSGQNSSSVD